MSGVVFGFEVADDDAGFEAAASLMIASGANVITVQSQLGHKTATMTLDQYGHLFPDDLDDVANKMDNVVSKCAQNVPTRLRVVQ